MGIYDREYYRDGPRGFGWLSGVAPTTQILIVINIAVFLFEWLLLTPRSRETFEFHFAAHSDQIIKQLHVWQLVTAPFLHSLHDPFHILVNMLFLWMVGRELEAMHGGREFLALYLGAAIVSTLCWALVDQIGPAPGSRPMVGASGAVIAAAVVYTTYYPHRQILLFFVLPIEMWLLLTLFIGLDLLMLIRQIQGEGARAGMAFAAHLGGAAYGLLYKQFDLRLSRLFGGGGRARRRYRVISPEPLERVRPRSGVSSRSSAGPARGGAASSPGVSEDQLNARLDEVLAKIAREGRDHLTDEENQILQEASRRARDRRSEHFE